MTEREGVVLEQALGFELAGHFDEGFVLEDFAAAVPWPCCLAGAALGGDDGDPAAELVDQDVGCGKGIEVLFVVVFGHEGGLEGAVYGSDGSAVRGEHFVWLRFHVPPAFACAGHGAGNGVRGAAHLCVPLSELLGNLTALDVR